MIHPLLNYFFKISKHCFYGPSLKIAAVLGDFYGIAKFRVFFKAYGQIYGLFLVPCERWYNVPMHTHMRVRARARARTHARIYVSGQTAWLDGDGPPPEVARSGVGEAAVPEISPVAELRILPECT